MKITDGVAIVKRENMDTIVFKDDNISFEKEVNKTDSTYDKWSDFYDAMRYTPVAERPAAYAVILTEDNFPFEEVTETEKVVKVLSDEEKITKGLTDIIKFFSEFEFEPNYRFINTLGLKLQESKNSAIDYIKSYFELTDSQYKNEVVAKLSSREFTTILSNISVNKPTNIINKRFKVYYGSAGTGKTTLAQKESENRCIVCNASMLPADLMEDFVFIEGKPSFKPSVLWDCMTEGKPIVLDEINLLPFDSLRFLQGILDGKKEFDYKGHKVVIADGFEVIGTMNLAIGGMIYGLPEPLIDRCADMRKFVLNADMLKSALS